MCTQERVLFHRCPDDHSELRLAQECPRALRDGGQWCRANRNYTVVGQRTHPEQRRCPDCASEWTRLQTYSARPRDDAAQRAWDASTRAWDPNYYQIQGTMGVDRSQWTDRPQYMGRGGQGSGGGRGQGRGRGSGGGGASGRGGEGGFF